MSIVILGAGLTGISTAYHLEQLGCSDYLLFEKESEPGGLCRTVLQDGFTFDFTGHLLHTSDEYFRQLLETTIGFENLNAIHRRSFIYSHDIYTRYPFQINLFGLPPEVIVNCVTQYVNRPAITKPRNFREWVHTTFGEGFGNHFFYTYQEKIFSYPIDKLTASWTNRFVPQTSLEQILHGSLADQYTETIGYNAQFFYPKQGGIYSWIKQFAHRITKPIFTDMTVKKINAKTKELIFHNGHIQKYKTLITTLPLDTLLHLLEEPSNGFLASARHHLKCNQVLNFNIGVDYDISDKHWIYFPEKKYPFYRIGFPHNFAHTMAPEGCGSLYGEFAYIRQSDQWISDTLQDAKRKISSLLGFDRKNIKTEVVIQIPHAYVIFDQWRDDHIDHIHQRLAEYDIRSIGRYGAWKYASMQEAVLDGKQMAETLLGLSHETITPAHDSVHKSRELPR